VDRAVTAVEMVEGAGRAMTAAEPGSPAWDAAAEQVRAAADALADHLRARRAVR